MAPQQSSSIDLSAGLQPAQQSAPPPAPSSGGIDLSAGMQPVPPAAPQPGWRERLLSHFGPLTPEDFGGTMPTDPLSKAVVGGTNVVLGRLHTLGTMALHPVDTAETLTSQAYHAGNVIQSAPNIVASAVTGKPLASEQQAASVEQLRQAGQQARQAFKENPTYAFGQYAPALPGEPEVVEPTMNMTTDLGMRTLRGIYSAAADRFPDVGRGLLGVGKGAARDTAREVVNKNVDIQRATEVTNAQHAQAYQANVEAANTHNAQAAAAAAERSKQLHMQAQNSLDVLNQAKADAHAEDVKNIQAANDAATAETNRANQEARDNAATQHAQDMQDALAVEGQRGELARQAIQQKVRLANNVQKTAESLKTELGNGFNQVRDTVNKHVQDVHTNELRPGNAPAGPLEAATQAEIDRLAQTTSDAAPHFQAIINQFGDEAFREDQRDSLSQSMYDKDYDKLSKAEKPSVDEAYVQQGLGSLVPRATFGQLRRLSTKLGTAAYNAADPYIARSLSNVKSVVDAMAQKMASDAGVGAQHARLLQDWANYKDIFGEATGPSGSGSQVAQSVNAVDAHHATAPFLSDDDFVANRARQLLVGKPKSAGGTYYNPQGGRLIDALRKTQAAQDLLPKPKSVPDLELPQPNAPKLQSVPSASPTQEFPTISVGGQQVPGARVVHPGEEGTPSLKPQPELKVESPNYEVITPESIEQSNIKTATAKIKQLRQVTRFQINAMANAGFGAALALSHMFTGATGPVLHTIGSYGAVGLAGLTLIRALLDDDNFIRRMAKPTVSELSEFVSRVPEAQRPGVEEAIRKINAEGLRTGKLSKPSPWIKAFDTYLKVGGPPAAATNANRNQPESEEVPQ